MPEYPDISLYIHALKPRVVGQVLLKCRVASPFILRSFDPPISALEGKSVRDIQHLGKRIVFEFEDTSGLSSQDSALYLIVHLMIAGRFRWRAPNAPIIPKIGLAAFDSPTGTLQLTEAGTKKRASIYLARGRDAMLEQDPGGIEIFESDATQFRAALQRENHTLKRTLTDPHVLGGIGNSYSDEILHRAKLSPLKMTSKLTGAEIQMLFETARAVLSEWAGRLIAQTGAGFPESVTAFRPEMAVHGKFGQPCPVCGSPVQRIVYAENEANYCATCQTGGKLLADRSLSRLLKRDWPKTLEELEERKAKRQAETTSEIFPEQARAKGNKRRMKKTNL